MLVTGLTEDSARCLQVLRDWLVGVKHVLTNKVGDEAVELTLIIDRDLGCDSRGETHALVILTVGGRLVNDTGAIGVAHVVVDEHLPVVGDLKLGFIRVVVE